MQSFTRTSHTRRSKSALVITIGMLGALAGCSGMTPYKVNVTDTVLLCSTAPRPPRGPVTIDIEFQQDANGVWCPAKPRQPCPAVFKDEHVSWQAVKNVNGSWEPLNTKYAVYFSPIQAHTVLKSGANGKVEQKKIDVNTPKGVYKYTVWDDPQGGDPHQCDPLDPNFFVH